MGGCFCFFNNHLKGDNLKSRFHKIGLFRPRAPVCESNNQCPSALSELGDGWMYLGGSSSTRHSVVLLMPLLGEEGPPQCDQLSLAVILGGTA